MVFCIESHKASSLGLDSDCVNYTILLGGGLNKYQIVAADLALGSEFYCWTRNTESLSKFCGFFTQRRRTAEQDVISTFHHVLHIHYYIDIYGNVDIL